MQKVKNDDDKTMKNQLMQELVDMPYYNYLSEEDDPRHMLFYICVLNEQLSAEDQGWLEIGIDDFDLFFS